MASGLIPRIHLHTLLVCFLLAIVCIDQNTDFTGIAPLPNVLVSFTPNDLVNLSVLQPLRSEFFDPLGHLVGKPISRRITKMKIRSVKESVYLRLLERLWHARASGLLQKRHV